MYLYDYCAAFSFLYGSQLFLVHSLPPSHFLLFFFFLTINFIRFLLCILRIVDWFYFFNPTCCFLGIVHVGWLHPCPVQGFVLSSQGCTGIACIPMPLVPLLCVGKHSCCIPVWHPYGWVCACPWTYKHLHLSYWDPVAGSMQAK